MSTQPSTTESEQVEAIVDLLMGASSSVWTLDDPTVWTWWDRSQSERGPGQGQPAELYAWAPGGFELSRVSADGDVLDETGAVEVWAYTLDEAATAQYARDVIQFISQYIDSNEQFSEFRDIQPSAVEDFREQKLRDITDHFVYNVEIQMQRLSETGL